MAKTAPKPDPVAAPAAPAPTVAVAAEAAAAAPAEPADAVRDAAKTVAPVLMLRITARTNGFRRAGVAHAATPTDWPADAFTPEQIAALLAEPNLVVTPIDAQAV
jgi:hypothetical protein